MSSRNEFSDMINHRWRAKFSLFFRTRELENDRLSGILLWKRQFAYFAFSVANNLNLIGLLLMYSYPTRRFNINNNNDAILQSMHVRGFTHCLVECVLCQTCTTVLVTALDATSNNAIHFRFSCIVYSVQMSEIIFFFPKCTICEFST